MNALAFSKLTVLEFHGTSSTTFSDHKYDSFLNCTALIPFTALRHDCATTRSKFLYFNSREGNMSKGSYVF